MKVSGLLLRISQSVGRTLVPPAPISKLRGRYRGMLLLKGSDEMLLRRVSEEILAASRKLPRGVQVALDARPVNML